MAKTETGWTKEFPKEDGYYWWAISGEVRLLEVIRGSQEAWTEGDDTNQWDKAYHWTGRFLGPVSPSDFEQLTGLRELCTEARDVLALLVPYGKIHTVEGVRYPDGSHSEAVDRGERVLNKLRDTIGKD